MFGSLRFRVPALFLLGIVLFGLVAAAIALRLFSGFTEEQSRDELQREARGIAALYADAALRAADEGAQAPDFVAGTLENATGDDLYYVGVSPFPGQDSGLEQLLESQVPPEVRGLKGQVTFEFTPPGRGPHLRCGRATAAARAGHRSARCDRRGQATRPSYATSGFRSPSDCALAFLVGAVIAGLLGWWLSRRITGPVLALSDAADEIAEGNYDVRVPAGRGDEIGHLFRRFNQMAGDAGGDRAA